MFAHRKRVLNSMDVHIFAPRRRPSRPLGLAPPRQSRPAPRLAATPAPQPLSVGAPPLAAPYAAAVAVAVAATDAATEPVQVAFRT